MNIFNCHKTRIKINIKANSHLALVLTVKKKFDSINFVPFFWNIKSWTAKVKTQVGDKFITGITAKCSPKYCLLYAKTKEYNSIIQILLTALQTFFLNNLNCILLDKIKISGLLMPCPFFYLQSSSRVQYASNCLKYAKCFL